MLALGIRYLNGFVAATEPDSRDCPEWPPHPARVFMALAAAHFQTGADPAEREALLRIEKLPPPALKAPQHWPRRAVTHFVPVNDKPGETTHPPKAIIESAPQLARDRQPRTFARAWLEDDTVFLVWPDAGPQDATLSRLASLCAKVTRLGHSTSFVQMWLATPDEVGQVNWVPDDARAGLYLRVTGEGTLAELEHRYNAAAVSLYASLLAAGQDDHDKAAQRNARKRLKAEFPEGPPPRLPPQVFLYQGYARPSSGAQPAAAAGTVFSPHLIVFLLERASGPFTALGLHSLPLITKRWQEALVSQSNDSPVSVREILSGHHSSGAPLGEPHLTFLPLAFIGHPHADGHLLGLAAVLPANLDAGRRRHVLRVLGRIDELKLGPLGVWRLSRDLTDQPPWNLRAETWTGAPGGAARWATVTPVAFDRHPKEKERSAYLKEVEAMIAESCGNVGLPRPIRVIPSPVSAHLGAPPAHEFPRLRRKDGAERRHLHAILVFDQPVRGPLLIGAGRYRGYGVCRPISGGSAA